MPPRVLASGPKPCGGNNNEEGEDKGDIDDEDKELQLLSFK